MVSWMPPPVIDHNGPLTGHVIQYTILWSNNTMNETVSNETTHIITGLVPFVNYSVRVAALTVNGIGPFSNHMVQVSGESGELYATLLSYTITIMIPVYMKK